MKNKILLLKVAISKMSLLFTQKIDAEKIAAYADMLSEYPLDDVNMAFKNIIKRGGKFFPSCAEIIQEIDPVEDENDMANDQMVKVLEAARSFSEYDTGGARSFLGIELFEKAIRFKSWSEWARMSSQEVIATRAQLRDFLKSQVKKERIYQNQKQIGQNNKLRNLLSDISDLD